MQWDWNDLRFFLAVARTGTTLGAAKVLGTNPTTCSRRVAALETSLDVKLFDRTAAGYALTHAGSALVPLAEQLEARAAAFQKEAQELTRSERSVIRLTTSDVLAQHIALPAIASFKSLQPDIHVVLDVERRILDLSAGEADIALRPARKHDESTLICRKLLDDTWAIYCAKDYTSPPSSLLAAVSHPFATLTGEPQERLMKAPVKIDIRYSMNTLVGLCDTIARGDCIGALPRFAGDRHERLQHCCDVPIEAGAIWVVYPERLKGAPHIRSFVDHLVRFTAGWQTG
jgi:DNA-binding transcriptional LysR family regulator